MDDWLTRLRGTLALRAWSFAKVPLLYRVRPSVVELSEERVVVSIPLLRRNRNHLQSMYFGALACGADVAGGLLALKKIHESGKSISLVFKDFEAKFLKRPEGDVHFTCEDGAAIGELVEAAAASSKRVETTVRVEATCPSQLGDEPVASFALTLSLKQVRRPKHWLVEELENRLPFFPKRRRH